jgi:hypothetical protein
MFSGPVYLKGKHVLASFTKINPDYLQKGFLQKENWKPGTAFTNLS